ncbi:MAG: hypothetical protein AAGC92_14250 [Pseudomonadota bacterium]
MKKHVPLSEASVEQLREFAKTAQGLDIHHATTKKESILARLQESGYSRDYITVDEDGALPQGLKKTDPGDMRMALGENAESFKKRIRILIPESDDQNMLKYAPVSVNGYAIIIRRGVAVDIPYPHYRALMTSREKVYETDADGRLTGEYRFVPAYPLQVLSDVMEHP